MVGHIPRWVTYPQTVTHHSSNHLIATRPGILASCPLSNACCSRRSDWLKTQMRQRALSCLAARAPPKI